MSNRSTDTLPRIKLLSFQGADKVIHAGMYAVLSALMLWAFNFLQVSRRRILAIYVFCVLWGGLMELTQAWWFTYRTAEWADFFANALGAMLVSVAFLIYKSKKNEK